MTDFTMFAGDDKTLEFTILQESDDQPVDLSGVTLAFRLQAPAGSIDKTPTIVDAQAGRADVDIARADTTAFAERGANVPYELQVTVGGRVTTLIYSTVTIKRNAI